MDGKANFVCNLGKYLMRGHREMTHEYNRKKSKRNREEKPTSYTRSDVRSMKEEGRGVEEGHRHTYVTAGVRLVRGE
jgi:hypothetical protein